MLTLITAENELRIIEPMNHVHYHAQQTGPIITNVMQPMMIPLVSVRSRSRIVRNIVMTIFLSPVDISHIFHINKPHPCPPVDTKFPPTVKPTKLLKRNSMASTPNARYDLNFHGGPEEMRNQLVELGSVDGNVLKACFSKEPKVNVTSAKSREVSNSRRTCEAKFTCPFEGCNGSFTRKHNLDSECSMRFDMSFWSSPYFIQITWRHIAGSPTCSAPYATSVSPHFLSSSVTSKPAKRNKTTVRWCFWSPSLYRIKLSLRYYSFRGSF